MDVVSNAAVADLQNDVVYTKLVAQWAMLADANHLVTFDGAVGHVLLADDIFWADLDHANAKRAVHPLSVALAAVLDLVDMRIALLGAYATPKEGRNFRGQDEEVVAPRHEDSLKVSADVDYGRACDGANPPSNGRRQLTNSGEGAETHPVWRSVNTFNGERKAVDETLVVAEHDEEIRATVDVVGVAEGKRIHAVEGLNTTMSTVGATLAITGRYFQWRQARIASAAVVNVEESQSCSRIDENQLGPVEIVATLISKDLDVYCVHRDVSAIFMRARLAMDSARHCYRVHGSHHHSRSDEKAEPLNLTLLLVLGFILPDHSRNRVLKLLNEFCANTRHQFSFVFSTRKI